MLSVNYRYFVLYLKGFREHAQRIKIHFHFLEKNRVCIQYLGSYYYDYLKILIRFSKIKIIFQNWQTKENRNLICDLQINFRIYEIQIVEQTCCSCRAPSLIMKI